MSSRLYSLPVCAALLASTTGCLSMTHRVPRTELASLYHSASVEQLEQQVNDRDKAITTLNARVLVTASTGSGKEGEVKEYTSLRGFIFARQPGQLRVLLQKPYLGSSAVDMVTDGKTFTLVINPLSGPPQVIEGPNTMAKPSKSALRNLRPSVFADSLLIPAIGNDDFVTLTESQRTLPRAPGARAAIIEPDYDLTVLHRGNGGNILRPARVIRISRTDMLPFQQDVYDDAGRVVTSSTYANYADFSGVQFPQLVTITRPLDELALKLEVTRLVLNAPLEADQFDLKLPPNAVVEHVE